MKKIRSTHSLGAPAPQDSAHLQVQGRAEYTDDIAELPGTLYGAFGLSEHAHAQILSIDLQAVRSAPGVQAVYLAADIPGVNDCGPLTHDDPVLADGVLQYVGQPLFLVIARSEEQARRAARLGRVNCQPLPAILDVKQAHAAQSYVSAPLSLARGDLNAAFAAAHDVAQGEFAIGGQEHFYLEGQVAYALPREDGQLLVYSSTQHPTEMQHVVAHVCALPFHQVQVLCRRIGGGFGGKESQSAIWAAAAAFAAHKLQRPVKLRADRDDDFCISGKRHPFLHQYRVAYDREGMILGADVQMLLSCGFSHDLSTPVANRAISHVDNAYFLPAVQAQAWCCKTNTQSHTAFRGFGCPQGVMAIEYALDDIARKLGKDALDVRLANLYRAAPANTTHYGQEVDGKLLQQLMRQLEQDSDYRARRSAINAFNQQNAYLQKGLALTPVKFGIAFNLGLLNQAGALVHVYTDGSVLVAHGGIEMGQGLHIKVMQVVAHEFGLPLSAIKIAPTDTARIPNTSATAASSGTDLNGGAARDAARNVRQRLARLAASQFNCSMDEVLFMDGMVRGNGREISFAALAQQAWAARIQLWSDGFYATPGLHWDAAKKQGAPYFYFAHGAAVAEVLLDTLSGEWKLTRADILYDAGQSLNPAIDIGQIEGGFVQGMGWLTTEQLVWDAQGRLRTHAPSTYKIPAVSCVPQDVRVNLYEGVNHRQSLYGSKAVGEPPLVLGAAVFFALRDAVSACAQHQINPPLQAPAGGEALLDAIDFVRAKAAA
ncbi:xanthine dehydrogenase molybdopterin binding subunit [Massilia sp. W12]|uniref:xanthine dehydrogenase molybdopterin binding subunit n=1 Tax=Massilia sp. W12 TaxID=3126507 RepID=UPI0030CB718D